MIKFAILRDDDGRGEDRVRVTEKVHNPRHRHRIR